MTTTERKPIAIGQLSDSDDLKKCLFYLISIFPKTLQSLSLSRQDKNILYFLLEKKNGLTYFVAILNRTYLKDFKKASAHSIYTKFRLSAFAYILLWIYFQAKNEICSLFVKNSMFMANSFPGITWQRGIENSKPDFNEMIDALDNFLLTLVCLKQSLEISKPLL